MPTSAEEKYLKTQLDEFQRKYDTLTRRITALDTDISRVPDSVTKQVREEQRAELGAERGQVVAEMAKIERQLDAEAQKLPFPAQVPSKDQAYSAPRQGIELYSRRHPMAIVGIIALVGIVFAALIAILPGLIKNSSPAPTPTKLVESFAVAETTTDLPAKPSADTPVVATAAADYPRTGSLAGTAAHETATKAIAPLDSPTLTATPLLTGTSLVPHAALSDCQGAGWNAHLDECTALVTHYLDQGQAFFDKKDCNQAVTSYETAISLQPAVLKTPGVATNIAKAYDCRGSGYNGQRDTERAIADLTRSLELDPALDLAYVNLAIAYTNRNGPGDQERAINALDRAIEIQIEKNGRPTYWYPYLRRCVARRLIGAYDLAIDDCTTAIDLGGVDRSSYYERGLAYFLRRNYEQAIKDFTRATELDPQHVVSYYQRGHAYKKQGKVDNAIADFEKVVALTKDDVTADMLTLRKAAELELRELKRP